MSTRNQFFLVPVLVGALTNLCNAHCMPLEKKMSVEIL